MITATVALSLYPKGSVDNIPGITYMLLMTALIPTFPPKSRHNTNDGAFFSAVLGYGAKDKATGKSRSDVQQRISSSQPGILNSLRGTTQFAGTDYRSKDPTRKNPGCWLTRFLRFISMAKRADRWIYHNPLIVRTAKTRSARSRQQTGKMATNHLKTAAIAPDKF